MDNATVVGLVVPNVDTRYAGEVAVQALTMGLIILFALVGNILILLTIYIDRTLRTMTNVFVVNLACADLLLALIGMPFTLVSSVTYDWIFGKDWCTINGMAISLFCVASMLTLAAVSIDRYIAILHPLKYVQHMNKRTATIMIVYIWAHSFIITLLPHFGWSRYIFIQNESICTLDWEFDFACTLFIFVVCFFIPLSVMMFTYYRVLQTARSHSRRIVPVTGRFSDRKPDERKPRGDSSTFDDDDANFPSQSSFNSECQINLEVGTTYLGSQGSSRDQNSNKVSFVEGNMQRDGIRHRQSEDSGLGDSNQFANSTSLAFNGSNLSQPQRNSENLETCGEIRPEKEQGDPHSLVGTLEKDEGRTSGVNTTDNQINTESNHSYLTLQTTERSKTNTEEDEKWSKSNSVLVKTGVAGKSDENSSVKHNNNSASTDLNDPNKEQYNTGFDNAGQKRPESKTDMDSTPLLKIKDARNTANDSDDLKSKSSVSGAEYNSTETIDVCPQVGEASDEASGTRGAERFPETVPSVSVVVSAGTPNDTPVRTPKMKKRERRIGVCYGELYSNNGNAPYDSRRESNISSYFHIQESNDHSKTEIESSRTRSVTSLSQGGNGKTNTAMRKGSSAFIQVIRERYNARRQRRQAAKRFRQDNKAARTLLIVVGTFILCWLPHFVGIVCLMTGQCTWPDRYFAITTWLAMLNSACNPIIYGAMSRQFRKRFKQILQCKRSFF